MNRVAFETDVRALLCAVRYRVKIQMREHRVKQNAVRTAAESLYCVVRESRITKWIGANGYSIIGPQAGCCELLGTC
jgi:hypothetical protein